MAEAEVRKTSASLILSNQKLVDDAAKARDLAGEANEEMHATEVGGFAPNIVYAPVRVSNEERHAWLKNWTARLRAVATEKPIDVGEY